MITIASLGLVWIVACLFFWVQHVKKTFKDKRIKFRKKFIVMWDSPWLLDAFISIVVIAVAYVILLGVTGMVIGLIASVITSILLWIWHFINAILKKKGGAI